MSTGTAYQEKFWWVMTQIKGKTHYFELYLHDREKIDRLLNIVVAIGSSGSIAAWAIWANPALSFVWAAIIGLMHVIKAISEFLPYKGQLAALRPVPASLDALFINAQGAWYYVQEGLWSDEEIHISANEFEGRLNDISRSAEKDHSLPRKEHLADKAAEQTKLYFEKSF